MARNVPAEVPRKALAIDTYEKGDRHCRCAPQDQRDQHCEQADHGDQQACQRSHAFAPAYDDDYSTEKQYESEKDRDPVVFVDSGAVFSVSALPDRYYHAVSLRDRHSGERTEVIVHEHFAALMLTAFHCDRKLLLT